MVALLDRCGSRQWPMGCFELMNILRSAGASAAPAQAALERRMEDTTGFQRLQAATTLRAVGGWERANVVIVEMARTGGDSDAENALRALAPEIKGDALPIFIEVLQRRDARTAGAFAAQQIGTITPGPEAAFPAIVAMAKDADPAIRRRVLPAFKGYRSSAATAQLGILMRDPDSEVRRAAFGHLKDYGLDAVPLLMPAFDEPDNIRHELFALLGKLGPAVLTRSPATVARLERVASEDPNTAIRMGAARAVATIRGTK